MKIKQISFTSEIKLYYSKEEPELNLVRSVSQIFDGSVQSFKKMPRHEVYLLEHGNNVYYAKKFFPTTFEQKLSYCIRKSKALKCFILFNQLVNANFKTIESVFVLNYQKGLKRESILVTKKTDGVNLKDVLIMDIDRSVKKEVLVCLLLTLGTFLKKGFRHNDPGLENFLIDLNKKPYEIIFMDLDAIESIPWLSPKRAFYSLNKLSFSIYATLVSQNNEKAYSCEQAKFYIEQFLKSYDPEIEVNKALQYLTRGIVKLFRNPKKYPGRFSHKALISIMKDWNV